MKELRARFGPGLAKALVRDKTSYSLDDLFLMLEKGSWVEAHTETSIAIGAPNGRSIYLLHITGTLPDIVENLLPQGEEKFRQLGYSKFCLCGNPAYLKILPKAGFSIKKILLEKELWAGQLKTQSKIFRKKRTNK